MPTRQKGVWFVRILNGAGFVKLYFKQKSRLLFKGKPQQISVFHLFIVHHITISWFNILPIHGSAYYQLKIQQFPSSWLNLHKFMLNRSNHHPMTAVIETQKVGSTYYLIFNSVCKRLVTRNHSFAQIFKYKNSKNAIYGGLKLISNALQNYWYRKYGPISDSMLYLVPQRNSILLESPSKLFSNQQRSSCKHFKLIFFTASCLFLTQLFKDHY